MTEDEYMAVVNLTRLRAMGGEGAQHAEVISLANAFVRYADSGQHGISTVSE